MDEAEIVEGGVEIANKRTFLVTNKIAVRNERFLKKVAELNIEKLVSVPPN